MALLENYGYVTNIHTYSKNVTINLLLNEMNTAKERNIVRIKNLKNVLSSKFFVKNIKKLNSDERIKRIFVVIQDFFVVKRSENSRHCAVQGYTLSQLTVHD